MLYSKLVVFLTLVEIIAALPSKRGDEGDPDPGSWQSRIKNVVVLVLENRSFDTFAGGFTYDDDINGLINHKYCNPVNASIHDSPIVCAANTAKNVAPDDPNHGISGVNYEVFSTYHPDEADVKKDGIKEENMLGFVTEQATVYKTTDIGRATEAINYYTEAHLPVFSAMAKNFVLFDRWFAAVPGPTNPNRAYITSGTSHGHGRNDIDYVTSSIPSRSIFQQLSEKDISWINYSNTSTFLPDAQFYTWTKANGKDKTNVKPLSQFYTDAKAGTLPQFTYINPECCSYQSFHPPSAVSDGEKFIKGIYEALRASPQWKDTFYIVTFDEHGGFGDHVPPPVNVPAGDSLTYTETAPDGKNITFDFTRLGVRVPTVIISPWVVKGKIEHKGKGRGGEYTHTSIPAFLAKLYDLDELTPRTAWSSTFEHLIQKKARDDTPMKLPDPVIY